MGKDIDNRGVWRWLLALLIVTLAIFGCSAAERWQYLDNVGTWEHQWLTAFTVKVVRNWLNEGAWSDAFLMLENPASIEFPNLVSRVPYISYPPGAVIPVWLLARILSLSTANELALLIHYLNLFSQLFIAIALGFSSFLLLEQTGIKRLFAFLSGALVAAGWLLLPGQMWWGQQVYFADQAVILPVALLILLEVLRTRPGCRRPTLLAWLMTLTAFTACFTDWYGLLAVVTLFFKQLLQGEYTGMTWRRRLGYWARFFSGPILALGIWLAQIVISEYWVTLWGKFRSRTYGMQDEWCQNFVTQWLPKYYSRSGLLILLACAVLIVLLLAYLIITRLQKRQMDRYLQDMTLFMAWVLGACALQTAILWNHSCQHPFSTFKYGIPLTLIGFSLAPASLWLLYRHIANGKPNWPKQEVVQSLLMILAFVGGGAYLANTHPNWINLGYLEFEQDTVYDWTVEDTLDELTGYEDVVFSTTYEIPILPPYQLARSAKRVYLAPDYATMRAILDPIGGDYNVCLLVPTDDPGWMNWAFELEHEAFSVGEDYALIRIDKAVWLAYLGTVGS